MRTRWYSGRGRRVLEYWRIDGLRHAWSGGRRKAAFIDPHGPRAADVMMSFFQRHRLPAGPARATQSGRSARAARPPGAVALAPPAAPAAVAKERPVRPPMIWFDDTD